MSKKLAMRFNRSDNKIYAISLDEPKDDLTGEAVKGVMTQILEKALIVPDTDISLTSIHDARITVTTITPIEM